MRTQIVFDSKNKKIILASCFAKKAQDPKATEYKTLQQVHRDFPDFEIAVRTIKKNTKKETYAGLTYQYMLDYLRSHGKAEDIKEFEEMKLISECHRKGLRYPTIKKWFLEKYPDIPNFKISKSNDQEEEKHSKIVPQIIDAGANKEHAA